MKICIVGGEDVRMRIPLVKALISRGVECTVIGSEGAELFVKEGVRYRRYDLNRSFNPFSDIKSVLQLHNIISDLKPDIIHAFDTKPALLTPLLAFFNRRLLVVRTITGMGYLFSTNELKAKVLRLIYRWIQRLVGRLSGATIFQNSDDMDYFLENNLCKHAKAHLVRSSGLDVSDFLRNAKLGNNSNNLPREFSSKELKKIIMVSRLVADKGIEEYLLSARAITSKYSDVRFFLVGPRDTEGTQAIPKKLLDKFTDCVKWLGPRSDVPNLLSSADVFVLPSYYREGVPRVLLEAGAIGLPLITTDMPGCREVVIDGWNGFLIKPRSSKSLTLALEKLIQSSDFGQEMGKLNVSFIKNNFDLSIVSDSYLEIYEAIQN